MWTTLLDSAPASPRFLGGFPAPGRPQNPAPSDPAPPSAPGPEADPPASQVRNGWTALDLSRAILLKVTLEGKDFQTARREAEREAIGDDPPPSDPPPQASAPGSAGLAVDVHEEGSLDLLVTDGDVRIALQVQWSVSGHLEVQAPKPKDPLALNLDGGLPQTTGAAGAHAFDLAGDGGTALTSFVTGRSAFLALDRDGDGRINSGLELFGDQHGAADGYAELAKFDANRDGRIDEKDPVFAALRLLYGDGRQEDLASAGIASLDLGATAAQGTTSGADALLASARATLRDGGVLPTYALGLRTFDAEA